jgi:uncharacterized protein (DUF1778 family)
MAVRSQLVADCANVDVYGELTYIHFFMATAAKSKQKRELKSQRLELRVAPSTKALILRAMAISGLPAADLALQGAKQVLDDHERMVLRGADREVFLAAVRNPPKPSPRLTEAFRLHAAKVTH